MKRPNLVHFISIHNEEGIAIRASISTQEFSQKKLLKNSANELKKIAPFQSLNLLGSHNFRLKLVALNSRNKTIFSREYETDSFGNLSVHISSERLPQDVNALHLYEINYLSGLELILGTFIPIKILDPKHIVISDFDKTLVDTRYSTTKEIYQSITKPLDYFPSVDKSIDRLKSYIENQYQPFILTASPHFYEEAIRNWLYKNEIFTAGIFLKDYRQLFSFSEGNLSPKDIKSQGFYKLNHLIDILAMTGMPDKLVLMGDGFESDPLIYLLLYKILIDHVEPRTIWDELKGERAFRLTTRQQSYFLGKLYHLESQLKKHGKVPEIKIHIRTTSTDFKIKPLPRVLEDRLSIIEFYDQPSTRQNKKTNSKEKLEQKE